LLLYLINSYGKTIIKTEDIPMKKFLFVATLLLAMFLAACGGGSQPSETDGGDASGGEEAAVDTPTAVVLATPTPKPAPPTPTPRPTATPAPVEEKKDDTAAATEEPVPAGPLFDDMILIEAGPFTMGQDGSKPKNGPAHEVDLPAYEIDHFEVTNEEFAWFVEQSGYQTYAEEQGGKNWSSVAEGKESHPVVYITWNDAVAYCEWAGKRLPTEAEWEKAARGAEGVAYPWGNDFLAENGNFYEGGIRGTVPVGSFPSGASPFGIEDMAGNVREWVQDQFLAYPGAAADADPFFSEDLRIHRGGGWFDGQDGEVATTYNRNAGPPDISANDDLGFRCARDAQ
jgi:formylglycine-generating enzyme required for sulfatase activity